MAFSVNSSCGSVEQLSQVKSEFDDDLQPRDSGETGKPPTAKDPRKKMHSTSWTKDSSFYTYDGYSWRKYGQRVILNCPYPRYYFRCSHKFDQRCLATKQVQRIATDPPKYRTTYFGHHTCKNTLKNAEIIPTDPRSWVEEEEDDILLDFGPSKDSDNITRSDSCASYIATANSKISGKKNQHLSSTQESTEEASVGPNDSAPSLELNLGRDLRSFVSAEASMSSDYGSTLYSSSTSKSSGMNSGTEPIDFDAGFCFHI